MKMRVWAWGHVLGFGLGSETLRISSIRLGRWSVVSRSLSRRCSEIVGVGSG